MKEVGKYFDLFSGGKHLMSEMDVAKPAAETLLHEGTIVGQHCFVPQADGTVVFDLSLSIPQEVRKRRVREELRSNVAELRRQLPKGPNKR